MPAENPDSTMDIHILKTYDSDSHKQINHLLHQLNPDSPGVSESRLIELLENAGFFLFIARNETNKIIGMLTLTACQTLSYTKYWIEDVIVNKGFRGLGAGEALLEAALTHVKAIEEQPKIYLTSNPTRIAARNLYRSKGFEEYNTGVFRII